MWPKRKILLLVPPDQEGWQGILSLLNALHSHVVARTTWPEAEVDLTDLAPPGLDVESPDLSDGGPTEILYWPEIPPEDPYRRWGFSRGLMQTDLLEFLHRYWGEEILLPVSQTSTEEEPFLWRILDDAGFEPSLLWPKGKGQWDVRIGNGLHWIIPETWYRGCWGQEIFGRQPRPVLTEGCWVRQEERIEFYSDKKRLEYLGSIKPYKNKAQEDIIYSIVLQALQLGVPWRSIRRAYDTVMDALDSGSRENIRWYANDFTGDEWPGRATVPSEETEYMANRGVG